MDYFFCKKCGRVIWGNPAREHSCDICNTRMTPVPEKYIKKTEILTDKQMKERVNEPNGLYEELVKPSLEFDQYLFDQRDIILAERRAKYNAATEHGKAVLEGRDKGNSYGISCPYCNATNIKKISTTSRIISIGLFGLGSKKIGKQWHCTKCGSDF